MNVIFPFEEELCYLRDQYVVVSEIHFRIATPSKRRDLSVVQMVARCNNAGMSEQVSGGTSRRRFLGVCSTVGLGQTLLPGVLFGMAAQAQSSAGARGCGCACDAEDYAGDDRCGGGDCRNHGDGRAEDDDAGGADAAAEVVAAIRTMKIPNSVAPAFVFDPVPAGMVLDTVKEADADELGELPDVAGADDLRRGSRRIAGVCFGAGAGGAW